MWIKRDLSNIISNISRQRPAILLTGARQTGKTSLLGKVFPEHSYLSLDLPLLAEAAENDGQEFLRQNKAPIIIDEVQYAPKLFRYLKIAIDQNRQKYGQYLLTGSQKFSLMANITESLAGRISIIECYTLSILELEKHFKKKADQELLKEWMQKGGYPEIYSGNLDSSRFYSDYLATYLERDVRQLIGVKDLREYERFIRTLALRSGQMLSYASMASELGMSPNTIKSWISVLEASQIVVLVPPFHSNFNNRIKKTPKVFFTDTGLLCNLLGIHSSAELSSSPLIGAIFETHTFNQIHRYLNLDPRNGNLFYYRDSQGREIDFIIEKANRYRLIECKWSENPKRKVAAFDFFEKKVGSEKIAEKRIATPTRTSVNIGDLSIGNSISWDLSEETK